MGILDRQTLKLLSFQKVIQAIHKLADDTSQDSARVTVDLSTTSDRKEPKEVTIRRITA